MPDHVTFMTKELLDFKDKKYIVTDSDGFIDRQKIEEAILFLCSEKASSTSELCRMLGVDRIRLRKILLSMRKHGQIQLLNRKICCFWRLKK
jgi:hypothetical protein